MIMAKTIVLSKYILRSETLRSFVLVAFFRGIDLGRLCQKDRAVRNKNIVEAGIV